MDMNEGRHFSELAAEIVAAYVSNNIGAPGGSWDPHRRCSYSAEARPQWTC